MAVNPSNSEKHDKPGKSRFVFIYYMVNPHSDFFACTAR
jgi:hypothetical protein